ncbi:biotin transporter BioY [Lysinibacter cavernae]|uniref:Biotin transporter n=1 Tax=Lysinibacter cavernae TaxID=1640652 RepID=A0A7X5TV86_9MICO|nr:biotin transporter BioY [Lysinibacter cavernae]NIH54592.1 biotin transport system substrate-specific component [Lysinibacter cavernae]
MTTLSIQPTPRVLVDQLVARRSLATDIAAVGVGALVVALLAQVSIPLWPVPITGQTLAVILVGTALGSKRGAAALTVYALAGLAGAPVFANFTGGPGSFFLPSFGFVIGFIATAAAIGWLTERFSLSNRPIISFAAFTATSVIPFLFGVPYMAMILSGMGVDITFDSVMAAGVYPFIVGGLIKAALAAALMPLAWKIAGRLRRKAE